MKVITREIIHTRYTFGNFDVSTGNIFNVSHVTTPKPMTRKQVNEYSKAHEDAIMLKHEPVKIRYSLPVEEFIKACENYSKSAEDNGEN